MQRRDVCETLVELLSPEHAPRCNVRQFERRLHSVADALDRPAEHVINFQLTPHFERALVRAQIASHRACRAQRISSTPRACSSTRLRCDAEICSSPSAPTVANGSTASERILAARRARLGERVCEVDSSCRRVRLEGNVLAVPAHAGSSSKGAPRDESLVRAVAFIT